MANKTIKFYGKGYSADGTDCAVIITFNGNTVYTGTVPTTDDNTTIQFEMPQGVLASFEVDEGLYGTVPVTIEVTAGDYVVSSYAESSGAGNPADPAEYYVLSNIGPNTDNRSNVQIDGIAQTKGPLEETLTGPWWWTINNGSTLSADFLIKSWDDLNPGPPTP